MNTIPRTIHYVWVGDKSLTPLAQKCIATWHTYMSDYEYRFWTEENIPMNHPYVQHMYQQKRWAFVADYVRFWALYNEGGVYLDTDTEVLKPLDDLLEHDVFFGKTKDGVTAAGVIGAKKGQEVIKAILEYYNNPDNIEVNQTSPQVVTQTLADNSYSNVKVYDYQYFNPCDDGERCTKEKLENAYTKNHWAESWVPYARVRKMLRRTGLMSILKKILPRKAPHISQK